MNERILVIDDEVSILEVIKLGLEENGFKVDIFSDPKEALEKFSMENYDAVLTDINMPEMSGLEVLHRCKEIDPESVVILITAYSSIDSAIEAIRGGALDYIRKPFRMEELILRLKEALERVRTKKSLKTLREEKLEEFKIIGNNEKIREIREKIEKVASTTSPVLIYGESGTGKELVANLIHYHSNRPGRFVPINCSAFPSELLESELFGYKKGAFTGADRDKKGLFEVANKGTLFLDEISTLPLELQPKILRAIQEMSFTPLGGTKEVKVDVRIVSATNENIEKLVEEKKFREDLYYRLNVIPIRIPPLRERREDILALVQHFNKKISARLNLKEKIFTDDAYEKLMNYKWPGNVRELENFIERLIVLESSEVIDASLLPDEIGGKEEGEKFNLEEIEKRTIKRALEVARGDKSKASELLGIHPSTLYRKIKSYKLESLLEV
ncbi:MAG: sigma-54 dependent transcriptional regulator [candidate division WOR-3 bacterium]